MTGALIRSERLLDVFLQLETGVAGSVLQKFQAYNIKLCIVLEKERVKGRFNELMLESNKERMFRVCETLVEAEEWLTNAD